jgi:hypothetical protein
MSKNNKSGIAFYSENKDLMATTLRYRLLDVSISEKAKKEINRIKKEKSQENTELTELDLYYLSEVVSIRNNTKNWRYNLNLRGLICYLNNKKNINEVIILKILTNPILLKHAPFLYNCQFFKDLGFPLLIKMINIAKDYSNIKDSEYYDDLKLKQSITDRYLDEFSNFYGLNKNNFSIKKEISTKFKEYILFMFENKKSDLEKELQITGKIINQLKEIN